MDLIPIQKGKTMASYVVDSLEVYVKNYVVEASSEDAARQLIQDNPSIDNKLTPQIKHIHIHLIKNEVREVAHGEN